MLVNEFNLDSPRIREMKDLFCYEIVANACFFSPIRVTAVFATRLDVGKVLI